VIVPVCDHFFDGTDENRPLLDQIFSAFPQVHFLIYPFIPAKIPKNLLRTAPSSHFWHSLSRFVGASVVRPDIESLLFIDADEIAEGARFTHWLDGSDYEMHTALKLANYWYFREPVYQAKSWEDSILLVQRRALSPDLLIHEKERDAIYELLPGPKRRHVVGADGLPLFHHYSWVRTKDELLKKVGAWGHKGDRNWIELVEKEFESPFRGVDFVHGYSYTQVAPPFNITLSPPSFTPKGAPRVERLSPEQLLALLKPLDRSFWDWARSLFALE
jgi:hypothetical protein